MSDKVMKMLRVYEVSNDMTGCSYVRIYVIAESQEEALTMARSKFKRFGLRGLEVVDSMECRLGMVSEPSDEGMDFNK